MFLLRTSCPSYRRCAVAVPVATDLPGERELVQGLPSHRLRHLRASVRPEPHYTLGIELIFRHGRRLSSSSSSHPVAPAPRIHVSELSDPETAVDVPVIDYFDNDPSPLSSELPDGGAPDPDATTDNYYYPEGAYYYVEATDD
ncbi:uncharacterized protein [Triticum aestivum]|uniref:uncharacterized protein n=1 Tax=Triticum aestivum TaxID=4565 RepID=UPI001D0253DF|nr:uncharacterized protein LOC123185275 [Triticum aestivum]